MLKTPFASFGRRAQVALLVAVGAAATASVMLGGGDVSASTAWELEQEAEIVKLPVCYALGTDAIGRGDVAGGKAIYTPCFTPDAVLSVYFPGTPFSGPPSFSTVGASSWGDFVSTTFTTNGYTATQHLMGSFNVHVDGLHATMTSYLHATHTLADGTIDVANGTYEDEVVRVNGIWKIESRTLKLITFLNLGTPTP